MPAELARRVDNVKGTEASARRPEIGGKKVRGEGASLPELPKVIGGQLPKEGASVIDSGALGGDLLVSSLNITDNQIQAGPTDAVTDGTACQYGRSEKSCPCSDTCPASCPADCG